MNTIRRTLKSMLVVIVYWCQYHVLLTMAVLWLQFNLYVCDMINIYWNGHLSKQYSIMIYTVKTILI